MRERVAQPVEHLTFNQRVSGSNPDALTKDLKTPHTSVKAKFTPRGNCRIFSNDGNCVRAATRRAKPYLGVRQLSCKEVK